MSQDSRADQIAFHLYTKLFSVVSQARTTSEPRSQPKVDRWFNLETPESELFSKDAREPYKSVSQNPPPPLEIQVLLAVPDLAHTNQGLVLRLPDSSRTRIHPPPSYILLESYTMTFTAGSGPADVPLPTIYKAGIPLFRSLYTLLRLLPSWKLYKRLRRRAGVGPALAIVLRVVGADSGLGFGVDGVPPLETQTHAFTEVPHPMGVFVLSVRYLSTPAFQLDELESLLSSRFMSLDERPFVPTLARRPDPSPPAPVPTATALADRFLLPSAGSSPGRGIPLPLPPDRQLASSSLPRRQLSLSRPSSTTAGQHRPSPSYDLSHRPSPSNLEATRTMLRQESAHHRTSSASSSLSPTNSFFNPTAPPSNLTLNTNIPPSSSSSSSIPPSATATTATPATAMQGPGQTPPRRPVYPFPFKSNTLASSSISAGGLGSQPSSLNDRVGIHDRMAGLNERRSVDLAFTPATSASPIPHAHTTANTPITTTAGTGDDQGTVSTTTPPTRKRYSSSFGHRYVSGGLPGSAGSAGSGVSGGGGGPGSLGTGAGGTATGPAPAMEGGSLSRSGSRSGRPLHQVSGLGIQVPGGRMSPQLAEFPRPRNLSLDPQHSPNRASSFLAGHTDDDDISVFVQSIDTRKPLVGRGKEREDRQRRGDEERERERKGRESGRWEEDGARGRGDDEQGERPRGRDSHSRVGRGSVGSPPSVPTRIALDSTRGTVASPPRMRTTLSSPPTSPPAAVPISPRQRTTMGSPPVMASSPQAVGSPPAGLMLTSEREVDERLRRMNEAFFKSLEGLGRSTSRAGQSSSTSGDGDGRGGSGSGSGSADNEGTGGEREPTVGGRGFGHFRSASGGGYQLGVEGSGRADTGRSESPFRSSRGDGPRGDLRGSHMYAGARTDRAPLGAAQNDGRGAYPGPARRESSPYSGGAYPSIFARPQSGASRDRSEEVIGRLEFDYEGGGSRRGEASGGGDRRERSGRY